MSNAKAFGIVVALIAALFVVALIGTSAASINSTTSAPIIIVNSTNSTNIAHGCGCMPAIEIIRSFYHKTQGNIVSINATVVSPGCTCVRKDTFQWYNDTSGTGIAIAGQTGLVYNLTTLGTNTSSTFKYYITINDSYNTNQSNIATVLVTNLNGCGCGNSTTSVTSFTSTSSAGTTTINTLGGIPHYNGGIIQSTGGNPGTTATTTVFPTNSANATNSMGNVTVNTPYPSIVLPPELPTNSSATSNSNTAQPPVTISGGASGNGLKAMVGSYIWTIVGFIIAIFAMLGILFSRISLSKKN